MTKIVDKDIFIGLRKLDNWLAKQPWDKVLELDIVMQVRELITKIQEKGYYNEEEQQILNEVRGEWVKQKNDRLKRLQNK